MLVGAIIFTAVFAALGAMLWAFVSLPIDAGDDEHSNPDNFGV